MQADAAVWSPPGELISNRVALEVSYLYLQMQAGELFYSFIFSRDSRSRLPSFQKLPVFLEPLLHTLETSFQV